MFLEEGVQLGAAGQLPTAGGGLSRAVDAARLDQLAPLSFRPLSTAAADEDIVVADPREDGEADVAQDE